MAATSGDTSTTVDLNGDPEIELQRAVAGRWARRASVGLLAMFVVCGAAGVFGYRSATTTAASSGGYRVELRHPKLSRGGLPADWRLTIERADGAPIDAAVTVETTADYFATFDQNAIVPDPDTIAQTPDATTWTYEPSGESALHVRLDIRAQPDAKWTHRAVTTVSVGDIEVAELSYSTWFAP